MYLVNVRLQILFILFQVCENIQKRGWKSEWIDQQGAPYAYGDDQWVGYENIDSIKIKVRIYRYFSFDYNIKTNQQTLLKNSLHRCSYWNGYCRKKFPPI